MFVPDTPEETALLTSGWWKTKLTEKGRSNNLLVSVV